jgi:hypothetical protein
LIGGHHAVNWSADGWAIVGALAAVLAAGFWFFDRFEKRLKDGDDRTPRLRAARALTAPSAWRAYVGALRRGLGALDRWMGERSEWARGFGWCLGLAFAYPAAILLVFWLFGGSAAVGEVELLPPPEACPLARASFSSSSWRGAPRLEPLCA